MEPSRPIRAGATGRPIPHRNLLGSVTCLTPPALRIGQICRNRRPDPQGIMNLETLVIIAQDGPWCGVRPPGHPGLHPSLEAAWDKLGSRPELRRHHSDAFSHEVFGPEP